MVGIVVVKKVACGCLAQKTDAVEGLVLLRDHQSVPPHVLRRQIAISSTRLIGIPSLYAHFRLPVPLDCRGTYINQLHQVRATDERKGTHVNLGPLRCFAQNISLLNYLPFRSRAGHGCWRMRWYHWLLNAATG